jgi:hypothetical protein
VDWLVMVLGFVSSKSYLTRSHIISLIFPGPEAERLVGRNLAAASQEPNVIKCALMIRGMTVILSVEEQIVQDYASRL